ncbi:salivary glue protein Sgs-3 [Drosophila virilis]|uniref:DUF753 domain-containing protein n=1 Tax=Drosophila virilis TaxID=7244 RepID=B4LSI5_DROVI|nr:integumentary mucin C.1 [Drosophila virilis]EDW64807.1 uncharacterized protein Dvir_GJ17668 [Drosophila virilis]
MRRGNNLILFSALIWLLVAPACLADLMCYVCDDCEKVTKETPLLACNADFFNQGGSTEASTVTTTSTTTTITTTVFTTDEAPTSSSEYTPAETTTPDSTTSDLVTSTIATDSTSEMSTESTEAPMPTPATVGPPETTTGMPTPPAEDLLRQMNTTRLLPSSADANSAAVTTTTELAIRQRRALIDTSVSYHCYTVQKTVNNTMQTVRGCSRVEPEQSVCQELQVQSNETKLAKCDPCSMNACNGATSTFQSTLLATLLFALVAALLQRN